MVTAAIQDELPIDEPEIPGLKLTEADVIEALEQRYSATAGNGRRYATAYGVRSGPASTLGARPISSPWTCGHPRGSCCTAMR